MFAQYNISISLLLVSRGIHLPGALTENNTLLKLSIDDLNPNYNIVYAFQIYICNRNFFTLYIQWRFLMRQY
ncbi:hypothetical protein L2E82_41752 [Cichorium intybus]|uniref:Uncharacterized protein n=1 Tax=Cichorium intybus TaxID=13427 RepID=A0ACB8ZJY0_CICIN|nr:hypothetical protein L2E82_41752 [Cichorium intybus]